jgi:hypothetical protein
MGRLTTIVMLFISATLVAGCGLTPKPVVAVASVGVSSYTDDAAVLVFQLDVHTNTDEPLSLREVQYTASLDGQIVFRGTRLAETTATGDRIRTVEIPIPVRSDQVQWPLEGQRQYRINGTVAYLRPGPIGKMLYDLGLRRKRVRFGESGALDFQSPDGVTGPDQSSESSPSETPDAGDP